jgi:hypothetical protein
VFAPCDILVGLAGVGSPLQQHLQQLLILSLNSLIRGGGGGWGEEHEGRQAQGDSVLAEGKQEGKERRGGRVEERRC